MSEQLQIIRPHGRLDNATSQALEREALGVIDGGARKLLMDLADLDYISSAGLRVALTIAKRMKATGGQLGFCGLTPAVAEVFEISGVDSILQIHRDAETAAAALSG